MDKICSVLPLYESLFLDNGGNLLLLLQPLITLMSVRPQTSICREVLSIFLLNVIYVEPQKCCSVDCSDSYQNELQGLRTIPPTHLYIHILSVNKEMLTDQHRCSQIITGGHRSTQMHKDQHRCSQITGANRSSQVLTDQCRCTQINTGAHRPSQMLTDHHRCSQMLRDTHRSSQMLTDNHRCSQTIRLSIT